MLRRPGLQRLTSVAAAAFAAVCVSCGGSGSHRDATATPPPLPSPVSIAQQPLGNFKLGDPMLAALTGASTDTGRLGGTNYQIEVPDQWNGRLVMYMHGCCPEGDTLQIESPPDRNELIQQGFAWAASSFSANLYIPGTAADETAALWDLFVSKHGRPSRTYVMGVSMGGAGAIIAAERYADRFDGAMPLCASAGTLPHIGDWFGDFFIGGAYAAGVTQEQFDGTDIGTLINDTVIPALNADPVKRERFVSLYTALSGGERPLAAEGLAENEARLWEEAREDIGAGMFDNRNVSYDIRGVDGVDSGQFNAAAVRVTGGILRENAPSKEELTGQIEVPVYAVHVTGDAQNPLREEQLIRRLVDSAGKRDLLVQHAVRDPRHCGIDAVFPQLQQLIAWVEEGREPTGEDVLASDLSNLGGDQDAH